MIPWSTEYARSLTEGQWRNEIEMRFFDAISQEIESLPFHEPLRSVLDEFGVNC
jgi:hypothetical protein